MSAYSEQLKTAKPTVTITPTPLIMEKVGDKFRGLYLGLRGFDKVDPKTGEKKHLPVAHFYDGERVRFNMGAQLTRQIEVLNVGVSVEIVLTELKPNSQGGKTKIYSITPLDLPKIDLAELFGGYLNITAPAPEYLLPAPSVPEPEQELESVETGN